MSELDWYLQVNLKARQLRLLVAIDTQPLHTLPLSLPRLLRPAGVLWNRSRGLTPSAQLMLSCLEETTRRLAGGSQDNVLEQLDLAPALPICET